MAAQAADRVINAASCPGLHALCEWTELPARGLEPSAIARGLAKNDKKLPDLGEKLPDFAGGKLAFFWRITACIWCTIKVQRFLNVGECFILPTVYEFTQMRRISSILRALSALHDAIPWLVFLRTWNGNGIKLWSEQWICDRIGK